MIQLTKRMVHKLKIRTYTDPAGFQECFDADTGMYIRTDLLKDNRNTGVDAFARSDGPMLLDIGIMGHCDATSTCPVPCYQGRLAHGDNMTLPNLKRIIDEGKGLGLMQVALGGAGNPDHHERFAEIVKYCRAADVVPNYTTAGMNLTNDAVRATAEYCGAVAVSWHSHDAQLHANNYTIDAIHRFAAAGCTVNVHLVVTSQNISAVTQIVETGLWPTDNGAVELPVHAVVLLQFKPVGVGAAHRELMLHPPVNDKAVHALVSAITTAQHRFSVGMDACSMPLMVTSNARVDHRLLDTCEGARFSAYIFPDMRMTPCSFDQTGQWAVDLNTMSLHEAWTSSQFNDFRRRLHDACPQCPSRDLCMGGCPVVTDNVYCKSEKRLLV